MNGLVLRSNTESDYGTGLISNMVAYRVCDVFPCRLHGYKGAMGNVHNPFPSCCCMCNNYGRTTDSANH